MLTNLRKKFQNWFHSFLKFDFEQYSVYRQWTLDLPGVVRTVCTTFFTLNSTPVRWLRVPSIRAVQHE